METEHKNNVKEIMIIKFCDDHQADNELRVFYMNPYWRHLLMNDIVV